MATYEGTHDFTGATVVTVPQVIVSTCYETQGRFVEAQAAGGTTIWNTSGALVDTSATVSSYKSVSMSGGGSFAYFDQAVSTFACVCEPLTVEGSDFDMFFGHGEVSISASAITWTGRHYGFKITEASSGGETLYGTNADASSQTETDLSTAVAASVTYMFGARKNGTTDIKFYFGPTLKATHTTNIPAGSENRPIQCAVTNKDVASRTACRMNFASVTYDLV